MLSRNNVQKVNQFKTLTTDFELILQLPLDALSIAKGNTLPQARHTLSGIESVNKMLN